MTGGFIHDSLLPPRCTNCVGGCAIPTPETPKVLVVDDDDSVRLTLEKILELENIPVISVASGKECIEKVMDGFSGLILMDIMMPGMDGWDTTRALLEKGLGDRVLIVMLTAKDNPDQKMEGLQEYIFDYITKPFEYDEIILRIRTYLKYLTS